MEELEILIINKMKKCSRCGRYIKNQYIVGGKIYGPVCVEKFNKSIKSIPDWEKDKFTNDNVFNFDDYENNLQEIQKEIQEERIRFNNLKDSWYPKWVEQSKRLIALKDKVWSLGIIYSLADQTGLTWNKTSLNKKYFNEWIRKEPKWIENLSPKQIALIEKLEK